MDDQILSVDGTNMEKVVHGDAVQAMKDAGNTVVLVVRHAVALATSRSISPPHRNTASLSPEPPFITVVLDKVPGKGEREREIGLWERERSDIGSVAARKYVRTYVCVCFMCVCVWMQVWGLV